MQPIAERHDVSVARVALAWLLSRKNVMSIIVGAKTEEQLRDNLAAPELRLGDDELAALDEVSQLTPEYPIWMFERQGQGRVPETR
jgi:aryl-alcohol dehydrogenase-like predicted oxidoreductase